MSSSAMLLILGDANASRSWLRAILSNFGFVVVEAALGEESVGLARTVHFDAVLLEVDLPGTDGIEICRTMRKESPRLPIIMLATQDDEEHKVLALNAGADDYVTKPFQLRELVARLKALVRRTGNSQKDRRVINIGEIQLDLDRQLICKRGQLVHLTPIQFALVRYLIERAGQPVPHAELLCSTWGPKYGNELTYLRTFIRQLRLKLEDDPSKPKYLITDPHFGYRFGETINGQFGEDFASGLWSRSQSLRDSSGVNGC